MTIKFNQIPECTSSAKLAPLFSAASAAEKGPRPKSGANLELSCGFAIDLDSPPKKG